MHTSPSTIVLAGAAGDLGLRILRALCRRGARVTAVVRAGTAADRLDTLRQEGASALAIDLADAGAVEAACAGADCVVSALSGLGDTIIGAQCALLDAAVRAGVPRFIPSDYSIDYRPLPRGANRNFDLRRDFASRLDAAPIAATSIFNGAFADMLLEQAPLILTRVRRVLYWESADHPLDFTTKDDAAAFTAAAALDPAPPRALHVAGTRITARELAGLMTTLAGRPYRLLRAGGLGRLDTLIHLARKLAPGDGQVFPLWQGMQYLHNMFDARLTPQPLDNARYPDVAWTDLRTLLEPKIS